MRKTDINMRLSAYAQALINACGGLTSAALECDVSKTQLQRAADPNHRYTLKSSTIWHLEQACGQPIMSRALYEMNTNAAPSGVCPLFLGIDLADTATDLTVCISKSLKDGKVTVFEHRDLTGRTIEMKRKLSILAQAITPSILFKSQSSVERRPS